MSTDTDPAAARLAEIRERNERHIKAMDFTEASVSRDPAGDVRTLLGALEAARKLADEWDATAASLDASAARAAERGAMSFRTDEMAARAQAGRDCAQALRERIRAELLGEAGTDGN